MVANIRCIFSVYSKEDRKGEETSLYYPITKRTFCGKYYTTFEQRLTKASAIACTSPPVIEPKNMLTF